MSDNSNITNHSNQAPVTSIRLHTDGPALGTEDSPDELGRTHFARTIACAILELPLDSSSVISLEGPWGHGKTTVLNLLLRQFDQYPDAERPVVCPFNPWMIGNQETLVQSFLVQLAAAIGRTDHVDNAKKAANELQNYASVFSVFKFIPGAEPWASLIKEGLEAVGGATEQVAKLKELDVEQRRDAVVKALRELQLRVVVFIDDLDRLPPGEVFEMVRLIKAVGDFPGVFYVLCYDSHYIEKALTVAGIAEASQYLDKIVQTRLTLPVISKADMRTLIEREYNSLPDEATREHFPQLGERFSVLEYHGLWDLLETPRDIKRLFNRLRFFVEPGCRGEVNLADLIALQILALKAQSVYRHLYDNPTAYVGYDRSEFRHEKPEEVIEKYSADREKALENVPERYRSTVLEILAQLFPLIAPQNYRNHAMFGSDVQGGVSSPKRLAVALSVGVPSGEFSYAAAVKFLHDPNTREATLNQALQTKCLLRLLEHLRTALKSERATNPEHMITLLGRMLDTPEGAEAERESMRTIAFSSVVRLSWWLVVDVLEKENKDTQAEILKNLVLNPHTITLGLTALFFAQQQHGVFEDKKAVPDEACWLGAQELEQVTKEWADLMYKLIVEGPALKATKSSTIFFLLRKFHPEIITSSLDTLLQPDKFDQFVLASAPKGTDSVNGRFVEFSKEDLAAYGGDKLKLRAENRLRDETVTGELRYILLAIFSGRKIYLADGSYADNC